MALTDLLPTSLVERQARFEGLYAKCTFGAGLLLVVALLAYFISWKHPSFSVPTPDALGAAFGHDFLNIWMGGRSAFADGPAVWFNANVYNAAIGALLAPNHLHDFRYYWSYPPDIVLFTWPLGLMPYLAAYLAWCILGLAGFVAVAQRCGVERRNLPFLALAPAVTMNVLFGQNGFVTAALLAGGLTVLDRRPILAGVLFGILTVKPQLGILLPVVLVLTGRWRVIAAAAATTVVLVALTAAAYGPDIWLEYFTKVGAQQARFIIHAGGEVVPSALYAARQLGVPAALAWAAQIVESTLALGALLWTFLRRRDEQLSLAFLVTAVFLFTPYSYVYDLVVLAWVVAVLRQRADNAPIDHYLGLAVWVLPFALYLFGMLWGFPVGPFVLVPFAARLVWRLAHAPPQPAVADGRSLLLANA